MQRTLPINLELLNIFWPNTKFKFPLFSLLLLSIYRAPIYPVSPSHGTGFFSCPALKVGAHFGRLITKSLEYPKWHWLILSQMGALAYICRKVCIQKYPSKNIHHWTKENLSLILNNVFEDKSTKYLNCGNCKRANKVCIRGSQIILVDWSVTESVLFVYFCSL